MHFTLAHLSDVHLGPLPSGSATNDFALKRVIGAISWRAWRQKLHIPEIAAALVEDIKSAKPDHVAFTGDLINIAAHSEFTRGAEWLKHFGAADWISYTPGNHDAYVKVSWENGLKHWADYMVSDTRQPERFPFVRLRRNVALIGVNGATPQDLIQAGGTVGQAQLERLKIKLQDLAQRGFYRVVMIHHPPAPGLTHPLRSLSDAAELKKVIAAAGVELVLHGHNHTRSLAMLNTTPAIGVPSASMKNDGFHQPAAWNSYRIERKNSQWYTRVSIRQWNNNKTTFEPHDEFALPTKS